MTYPFSRMLIPAIFLSGLAVAADLNIGPTGGSKVTASFKQEGVEVESPFTRFSGRISYDPARVAASTALLEVETGSYDIGDPAYNAEVRKKSWFDSTTHPRAQFRSTAIKPGAAGSFEATGQLTLKGRVQTITVPVKTNAAGTVFDGSFVISRKAFGIGDPVWDGVLDDRITIKFHLVGGK
jgi:polyisoprenoid-binding protein YceI